MKKIIVIPAAGKGSRLHSDLPKIFTEVYQSKSIFDLIVEQGTSHVDEMILLLSPLGKEYFESHIATRAPKNVHIWVQESATGMFDAMDQIVNSLLSREEKFQLILQWGDQPFCDTDLHQSLFSDLEKYQVSVPLVWVSTPYVQFKLGSPLAVWESREGEHCDAFGFKDMGIFAFTKDIIEAAWPLYKLNAPKGKVTGERNFVKFFESVQQIVEIYWRLDQPYYKSIGINTPEELKEANLFLNQKNQIHHGSGDKS
jgi:bifunctional N-acetylglucosamine-1-phosphate-uridyltransferase/glucosamine-1-phosphate-acetyltransferase GlmU-like protein